LGGAAAWGWCGIGFRFFAAAAHGGVRRGGVCRGR
jgi:hypothetical protein